MSNNYYQMWSDLGLNIEAHDALLDMLGEAYQDIYLSQKNRPLGMEYFDLVMNEVHGLRIKELLDAKAEGRKVIGSFCVFVPEELVLAVNGILVGLCAGAEFGFEESEKFLPRNTCPLIKSAFGFKLGKVCPYFEASDMVVGENTCDGKKKSYEILDKLVDKLYVMDLPQMKSVSGKALIKAEYIKFTKVLENLSSKSITVDNLKKAITIVNNKREAIQRLDGIRKEDPVPISGLDALLANQVYFYDNPVRFTNSINKLCDELEDRVQNQQGIKRKGTPRILLSGCPMAVPNWKIPAIVETSNAVIVGEELCTGARGTQLFTKNSGDTVEELIDNIVDRYFEIDCALFTPNTSRLEHIKELIDKYNAQGVIHYCLQFCQPYQVESGPVEEELEEAGIPVIRIDTDYSQEDLGQIKTRIEAFIERIVG